MVKSLLKLTQPFIHNEPFTLHAIFLSQRMCATSDQQKAVSVNRSRLGGFNWCVRKSARSEIASLFQQPILGANSCVNID